MGFFDKVKGAMNFVSGGAAKVSIEWQPATAAIGEPIRVRITATSTGPEVASGGVFVDMMAVEQAKIGGGGQGNAQANDTSFQQSFQVAPAFQLAANETKQFEGQLTLPPQVQPTFDGKFSDHKWQIQARVEATGNDPDSGWQQIRVVAR